jgi:hypothetical protein
VAAEVVHELEQRQEVRARTARARLVAAIGPVTVVVGLAWAAWQPYRLTLLHPHGQGFWWLVSQPPLYVILVGVLFRAFVAPGLLRDLEEAERR